MAVSAIHGGQWLPEAMQFVRTHQTELAQKPFAAFLVCMTMAMPNQQYREHVATWLEPVSALVRPVSEGLFAGALRIGQPVVWRSAQVSIECDLGCLGRG